MASTANGVVKGVAELLYSWSEFTLFGGALGCLLSPYCGGRLLAACGKYIIGLARVNAVVGRQLLFVP